MLFIYKLLLVISIIRVQLMFLMCFLSTGVENAQTLGWLFEMCLSDSATFIWCSVTGIKLSKSKDCLLPLLVFFTYYYIFFFLLSTYYYILFPIAHMQLPPPQLESTLNKHSKLRGPLAAYVNQPSIRTSVPRYSFLGFGQLPSNYYFFWIS